MSAILPIDDPVGAVPIAVASVASVVHVHEALGPMPLEVPLQIEGLCDSDGPQPIAVGIPWPRGSLLRAEKFSLIDPSGQRFPVQASRLAAWPDGSVKWLLVEAIVGPPALAGDGWRLVLDPEAPERTLATPLSLQSSLGALVAQTGRWAFHFGEIDRPLARVMFDQRDLMAPDSLRLVLTDARGREVEPKHEAASLQARGPLRGSVLLAGRFPGRSACRVSARLDVFAGTGLARLRVTLHNPRRARHKGGLWDLGDRGSVLFRDFRLELVLTGAEPSRVFWTSEPDQLPQSSLDGTLEIHQNSSGGENWRSRNHVNRLGQVPCSFRGYRVRAEGRAQFGLRASPVVWSQTSSVRVAAAIPEFWQQFPKTIEVAGSTLRLRLFPEPFGDPFELQGGERKTYTLWLDFSPPDTAASPPLGWVHRPARARATFAWYASIGAIPCLAPPDPGSQLDSLLAGVVDGERSFFARREIIDEYGWRHFGEVYADHEGASYPGEPPVISHYNNQYDLIYGMIIQYLRSGDARWFALLDTLARHVMDIDIYHTDRDRPAYNSGLFWHTDHYKDAAICTHRSYSRANKCPGVPYGGGPCNEHNYTTGLLNYHYLTGDPDARDAVIGLADWVVAMDDGARNLLGVLDDGPTGLASQTREPGFHGPGRGCGNSINALLDGWLASGRASYLDKAEALIRRSIHPADDVEAMGLRDAERRWSYTVFLAALGRYLDLKAEAGVLDAMYAYARAALLRYAEWMVRHEAPYLDRPEELEYPTETWAAQDLRKANILRLAARHADEPLRSRCLARGQEIADRAWADLARFPTRDVARCLAILLREGPLDALAHCHPVAAAPRPPETFEFGPPVRFIPQRQRILARARTARGIVFLLLRLASLRRWRRALFP